MDGQDEVIDKQHEEKHGQESQKEQEQPQQQEGASASPTIIKGKRTKRQRPQSPIPYRIMTPPYPHIRNNSHNDSPTKSDHESYICSSSNNNNDTTNTEENSKNFIETHNVDHDLTLSTATTITTTTTTTTITEEEDMANCLILLAQGQTKEPIYFPPQQRKHILTNVVQEHHQDARISNNVGAKFMEITTADKSGGYYVYECKTCSKTFSSFQALDGHRASHKKPRIAQQPNTIRNNSLLLIDDDDLPFKTPSSSLSLNITNKGSMVYGGGGGNNWSQHHQSRPRVHDCAICGANFSSGQALGGHMRRHRGAVISVAPPPLAFVPAQHSEPMLSPIELIKTPTANTTLSLDLDLNLPAPTEDVVDKNQQPTKPSSPSTQKNNQQLQQEPQQQLVLSSLALVDCQY